MRTFLFFVYAALAAGFLYGFVVNYRAAVADPSYSLWRRVLSRAITATKDSATILWQRFVVVVAVGVDGLVYVANLLNEPQVAAAIHAYLTPNVVAAIFIATALIGELARRRTLGKG